MYKELLLILILFLVIDIPMIAVFNNKMYKDQFNRINNNKVVDNIYYGAIVAYLCLVSGLYYFVIKDNVGLVGSTITYKDIAIKGAIFGFVVYGIYNGTNKATIAEFGTMEAIKDTVWGTILCALISVLSLYIIKTKF